MKKIIVVWLALVAGLCLCLGGCEEDHQGGGQMTTKEKKLVKVIKEYTINDIYGSSSHDIDEVQIVWDGEKVIRIGNTPVVYNGDNIVSIGGYQFSYSNDRLRRMWSSSGSFETSWTFNYNSDGVLWSFTYLEENLQEAGSNFTYTSNFTWRQGNLVAAWDGDEQYDYDSYINPYSMLPMAVVLFVETERYYYLSKNNVVKINEDGDESQWTYEYDNDRYPVKKIEYYSDSYEEQTIVTNYYYQ